MSRFIAFACVFIGIAAFAYQRYELSSYAMLLGVYIHQLSLEKE